MKRLFALLLLLTPWSAQAVEGCHVHAPTGLSLPPPTIEERVSIGYGHIDVECEAGLPYQVEVSNAAPGGLLHLTSTGPTPIPVHLIQSNSRLPWGSLNHGEAMGGVGSGARTSHPIELGVILEVLPEPGVYRTQMEINLVF